MVVFRPEPLIVSDERSKALMFLIMSKSPGAFEFATMLESWFNGDVGRLADFLAWLDRHELKIGNKL